MTLGTSTRAVGSPIGSSAQYARQPGLNVVPLSVFFLQMQGEEGDEDDGNGLYGKRKRRKKRPERDREADGKVATDRVVGGDAEQASGQKRQSSASAESVTMSGGTPLLAPGGTGSGNVAGYPVPLGGMFRRVSPSGAPRRKKKKRSEEERGHWIGRLLK